MKILKSIGLVFVGLLLGGLITYLILRNDKGKDVNNLLSNSPPINTLSKAEIDSTVLEIEPEIKIVKEIIYVDTSYQVKTDTLEGDTLLVNIDSLNTEIDSVIINGEDFVVEKEQLISKSELVLIHHKIKEKDSLDSLLDSLMVTMNIKKNIKKSSINLELWKSPMGITGYKFTESGLMIYGLFSEAILAVHKYDKERYFLETSNGWYKLIASNDLNTFNMSTKLTE